MRFECQLADEQLEMRYSDDFCAYGAWRAFVTILLDRSRDESVKDSPILHRFMLKPLNRLPPSRGDQLRFLPQFSFPISARTRVVPSGSLGLHEEAGSITGCSSFNDD